MKLLTWLFAALVFLGASAANSQDNEIIPAHSDFRSENFGHLISANENRVAISDRIGGAVYVYVQQNGRWIREHRIPTPFQMGAIDLNGNRLAIGDAYADFPGMEQVGQVRVYEFSEGSGWALQSTIAAPEQVSGARFGQSLDLQGDRLLVGAPRSSLVASDGRAYVYEMIGGVWNLTATIMSNDSGVGPGFGFKVAFAGPDQLMVSSRLVNSAPGFLYSFNKTGASWIQSQRLYAGNPGGRFGDLFAVSGDFAVALSNLGLFTMTRTGSTWTIASTPIVGTIGSLIELDNEGLLYVGIDQFGNRRFLYSNLANASLAPPISLPLTFSSSQSRLGMSSGFLFVGDINASQNPNPIDNDSVSRLGSYGVVIGLARNLPMFPITKIFKSSNGLIGPSHGAVLAQNGQRLLVGAPHDTIADVRSQGSARIYIREANEWILEATLTTPTSIPNARFATKAAIRGNFAYITSLGRNSEGAAFIFARDGGSWQLRCTFSSASPQNGNQFGSVFAFDGQTLVIRDFGFKTFSVSQNGCTEQENLIPSPLPNGQPDAFFGRAMAMSDGVLVVLAGRRQAAVQGIYTLLRYTRAGMWSSPVELTFLPPPFDWTDTQRGISRLQFDGSRLIAVDQASIAESGSFGILHNWAYAGGNFTPTRIDALPFETFAGVYGFGGEVSAWTLSPAIGGVSRRQIQVSDSGTSSPLTLTGSSEVRDLAVLPNLLVSGQPIAHEPSNPGFGRVEFFQRVSGVWGPKQVLEILPDLIFTDNIEDVP